MKPNFRIRSIYDIALIKILSENLDYNLVQPNREQHELFDVDKTNEAYEIQVEDILDGYGVKIEGDEDYIEQITSKILELIPSSIVLLHPVQLHAIYNGQIVHVNYDKNLSIVDIGERINAIMFDSKYRRGQKVVVQVNELNVLGDQLPLCSDVIHFPGNHVILERDARFVRVSRKLPKDDRDDLFERGKEIRPRGHGLIMRTSAVSVEDKVLTNEIEKLLQKSEELDLLISGSSYGPGILQPGQTVAHVLFVKDAKEKLDSIRKSVTPTFPSYHWFMSYSENLKITTTFAERISDEVEHEKLSSILKEVILENDFAPNAIIKQQEYKLTSSPMIRTIGQLSWDDDLLVIKRSFRSSRGTHYAIDEYIRSGDEVAVYAKEGSWTIHTQVMRENKILGEYVKVVTPIELYHNSFIRYIDLGVMITKKDDKIEVNDTNELAELEKNGIISSSFKDDVYDIVKRCKDDFETNESPIINIQDI